MGNLPEPLTEALQEGTDPDPETEPLGFTILPDPDDYSPAPTPKVKVSMTVERVGALIGWLARQGGSVTDPNMQKLAAVLRVKPATAQNIVQQADAEGLIGRISKTKNRRWWLRESGLAWLKEHRPGVIDRITREVVESQPSATPEPQAVGEAIPAEATAEIVLAETSSPEPDVAEKQLAEPEAEPEDALAVILRTAAGNIEVLVQGLEARNAELEEELALEREQRAKEFNERKALEDENADLRLALGRISIIANNPSGWPIGPSGEPTA